MKVVNLYSCSVKEVPVYGAEDYVRIAKSSALPNFYHVSPDEVVCAPSVEEYKAPVHRFHCNGKDFLVAFDRELERFLTIHNDGVEERIGALESKCQRLEHDNGVLRKHQEENFSTFWRRLKSLFQNYRIPATINQ